MAEKRSLLSLIVVLIGLLAIITIFLYFQQNEQRPINLKGSIENLQKVNGTIYLSMKLDNLRPESIKNVTVRFEVPSGFSIIGRDGYIVDFPESGSQTVQFSARPTDKPGVYTLNVYVEKDKFREVLPISVTIEEGN